MVTIERVHIKNFRSLVDETIELSDCNFFVGKNDSGKSNVLKALNLFSMNAQTLIHHTISIATTQSLLNVEQSKRKKSQFPLIYLFLRPSKKAEQKLGLKLGVLTAYIQTILNRCLKAVRKALHF